eukprot:gene11347-13411_t
MALPLRATKDVLEGAREYVKLTNAACKNQTEALQKAAMVHMEVKNLIPLNIVRGSAKYKAAESAALAEVLGSDRGSHDARSREQDIERSHEFEVAVELKRTGKVVKIVVAEDWSLEHMRKTCVGCHGFSVSEVIERIPIPNDPKHVTTVLEKASIHYVRPFSNGLLKGRYGEKPDETVEVHVDDPYTNWMGCNKGVVINTEAQWQELLGDLPWNTREWRARCVVYLQELLGTESPRAWRAGAHGMWELAMQKVQRIELCTTNLTALVRLLCIAPPPRQPTMNAKELWTQFLSKRSEGVKEDSTETGAAAAATAVPSNAQLSKFGRIRIDILQVLAEACYRGHVDSLFDGLVDTLEAAIAALGTIWALSATQLTRNILVELGVAHHLLRLMGLLLQHMQAQEDQTQAETQAETQTEKMRRKRQTVVSTKKNIQRDAGARERRKTVVDPPELQDDSAEAHRMRQGVASVVLRLQGFCLGTLSVLLCHPRVRGLMAYSISRSDFLTLQPDSPGRAEPVTEAADCGYALLCHFSLLRGFQEIAPELTTRGCALAARALCTLLARSPNERHVFTRLQLLPNLQAMLDYVEAPEVQRCALAILPLFRDAEGGLQALSTEAACKRMQIVRRLMMDVMADRLATMEDSPQLAGGAGARSEELVSEGSLRREGWMTQWQQQKAAIQDHTPGAQAKRLEVQERLMAQRREGGRALDAATVAYVPCLRAALHLHAVDAKGNSSLSDADIVGVVAALREVAQMPRELGAVPVINVLACACMMAAVPYTAKQLIKLDVLPLLMLLAVHERVSTDAHVKAVSALAILATHEEELSWVKLMRAAGLQKGTMKRAAALRSKPTAIASFAALNREASAHATAQKANHMEDGADLSAINDTKVGSRISWHIQDQSILLGGAYRQTMVRAGVPETLHRALQLDPGVLVLEANCAVSFMLLAATEAPEEWGEELLRTVVQLLGNRQGRVRTFAAAATWLLARHTRNRDALGRLGAIPALLRCLEQVLEVAIARERDMERRSGRPSSAHVAARAAAAEKGLETCDVAPPDVLLLGDRRNTLLFNLVSLLYTLVEKDMMWIPALHLHGLERALSKITHSARARPALREMAAHLHLFVYAARV